MKKSTTSLTQSDRSSLSFSYNVSVSFVIAAYRNLSSEGFWTSLPQATSQNDRLGTAPLNYKEVYFTQDFFAVSILGKRALPFFIFVPGLIMPHCPSISRLAFANSRSMPSCSHIFSAADGIKEKR